MAAPRPIAASPSDRCLAECRGRGSQPGCPASRFLYTLSSDRCWERLAEVADHQRDERDRVYGNEVLTVIANASDNYIRNLEVVRP